MARSGGGEAGDCAECNCSECSLDNWVLAQFEGSDVGVEISPRGADYIDVQTELHDGFGGGVFAILVTNSSSLCCTYNGYEILSGPDLTAQLGTICGEASWPATGVHTINPGDEVTTVWLRTDTPSVVRVKFTGITP
jgi:hypothetical protein